MTAPLTKGQNAPITAGDVVVLLDLTAAADLSALLVTANGKVRSDADFVFFNQPSGPGVQLQPGPPGQAATLRVSLASVPADIDQIRTVITLEDATSTFGRYGAPTARLADANGNTLYEYRIDGLDTESIVIALELYRRQGGWKVRAVGQGYAGGFAALVTDHGVSVDDEPAAPAAPVAPPAPPAPPAAAPAPAAPPVHPAPPAAGAEVSLVKGRPVSLTKGQKVSLRKDGGVALTMVSMGLGWDPIEKRGMFGSRAVDVDLDASAVLIADNQIVDVAYYGQLRSKDGSILHEGDNLTGVGDGDDEVIHVDLTRVPPYITTVIFLVTSYKGHTFEQVKNAFCRLVDATTSSELARYTLQGGMPFTGMVMAKVFRSGGDWKLEAIGEGIQARHAGEAAPQLHRFIGA
ncbi:MULTISPECIES: TerD family protein [unclassified Rhodococcus (in: high G+C Gram-positive bacteria)]|uniref:TerD family protein n=1 Tax=unclassified Rhodococcus (in: high G+C Gram-positive bacteria) TaxID=192944 RepID=UPI000E0B233A|nr:MULTISPECIES: TerD family protein [unclassified Rhodococcus (in: high G+C Gram-positive bacteria)]QKT09475.1 TerD family protein [Rhodococcus sp. W8901]RDI16454.1 stress response protein SCP2 [Rhodococcus sp. AG1013]